MKRKSILIVEDNHQDELLILRALERAGLDCRLNVVRDGQQALDYLLGEGEYGDSLMPLPDMVFLDLSLPRVGGLDVLIQLRAHPRTQGLPVCVLTSSDEASDIRNAYLNGANGYVVKPLDFQVFADTLALSGKYWLLINRTPTVIEGGAS